MTSNINNCVKIMCTSCYRAIINNDYTSNDILNIFGKIKTKGIVI